MADVMKTLGQAIPAGGTLTTLYTVPGATSAVVSTVQVCNRSATPAKFRLSVAVAGAADESKQYWYYDELVGGNKSFAITLGIAMATTDVLRCQSDTGQVAFNCTGVEVT
jgi:hypothetical protein